MRRRQVYLSALRLFLPSWVGLGWPPRGWVSLKHYLSVVYDFRPLQIFDSKWFIRKYDFLNELRRF